MTDYAILCCGFALATFALIPILKPILSGLSLMACVIGGDNVCLIDHLP
jgi:hypothetical protein